MPKISLIVPVYKVSQYIEKCAVSLFNQTLDDMEFIFVDDCTPDDSMDIVKAVLEKYPNRKEQTIFLRNKHNKGVAYSRLKGLAVASGKYVSFVDSDDWAESNMYELLYKEGQKGDYDIVISNYFNDYKNKTTETVFRNSSPFECLSNLYRKGYFPYTLWCQVFRRHLFNNDSISKIQPTNHGEDLWLNICAHLHAKSVCFVPICLYHYNRTNESSMVKSFRRSKEKWLLQKQNVEMIAALLLDYDCNGMKIAVNWLLFLVKIEYKSAFYDAKEWFYTFRGSHRYIMKFERLGSRRQLLIIWLLMRSYLFYGFYQRLVK